MSSNNTPSNLQDISFFAETNFRNKRQKFGIKRDDRRRHVYIIGKTGMGKSTMIENMVYSDIVNGEGLAFLDPHGDSVETILDLIPTNRINDVIYFNPSDIDFPVAFNILEAVDTRYKHIIASGLIEIFKKLWADSWGPRLEYLLRNAILALLDFPNSTLLGIMRILTDKVYRKKVVSKITDPVVRSFWVDEYSRYPDKFQVEAISPIQNKVGQFLSNFLIRNIVGQVKSTFDIRQIMDEQKILLMNLSKGRLGSDTSALLGAMMVTKIQLAAMSRVDMDEEKRKDFYLYVDEFQNFATTSFAGILSEARKYRLNLIIGHQYIEQIPEEVKFAVMGNIGTLICFRVGAMDAEELVKEFTPYFIEEDLVNIPKKEIFLKLMIDGVASEPFTAIGLPPIKMTNPLTGSEEKIIKVSRERYSTPREKVEEKISRWAVQKGDEDQNDKDFNKGKNKFKKNDNNYNNMKQTGNDQDNKNFSNYQEKDPDAATPSRSNPAQCWSCNKITHISFVPDGKRPILCRSCLQDSRLKKAEGITNLIKPPHIPAINQMSVMKDKEKSLPRIRNLFVNPEELKKVSLPPNNFSVGQKVKTNDFEKKIKPIESMSKMEIKNNKVKKLKPGEVVKFD